MVKINFESKKSWKGGSPTQSTVVYTLHVHVHADIPNVERSGVRIRN